MKAFKEKGFAERRDTAAKAKEDNLKKFSQQQPTDSPAAAGESGGRNATSATAKKSGGKSRKD